MTNDKGGIKYHDMKDRDKPVEDMVNSPSHYEQFPMPVNQMIRSIMDQPEFDDLTAYQAGCLFA
jgi:hypothetical protein